MQYVDRFGHGLHQLIYVSRSILTEGAERDAETAGIVSESNQRNARRALTGALLVYGGVFVQVLEGDHITLETLSRKIEADPRHTGVVLKGVESIERRSFGSWGMREGRAPPEAEGVDLAALDYAQLLTLLKLSTRTATRKVA